MADAVQDIDPATAKKLLDRGDAVLIDVREPDEFARAHIEGATLMPLSSFDPARVDDAGARKIIIHCAAGARSAQAAARLAALGVANVANLQGGINAWAQAGYKVITGR